jgi:hypothetical protein
MKNLLIMSAAALALFAGSLQVVAGDAIPYPNAGTPNPVTYTFTAAATGPITAYFAGSTAAYDNDLGLLINGISTGIYGLNDHLSPLGQSLVLGNANAGDVLTFVLKNNTLSGYAYSDPALNVPYDVDGSVGHNHVYSTPYTATSPIIDAIPAGTYVAFEDLRFPQSDFNYFDESFVFVNVATTSSVPDAATTLGLLSITVAGLATARRRLSI